LARWRLRLRKLEFDVAYKLGMTHYLADSISRLESGASDETAFDDAVPVFAVRANTVRWRASDETAFDEAVPEFSVRANTVRWRSHGPWN